MRLGEALHHAVTGVVGGLLGAFSPKAALQYRHGRAVLLSYAAATRKGPNARWNPRDIHPDLMNMRDRRLVQARARDLVRNNPNVAGALEKISNNVVHTGIIPQAQLRDNTGKRDKSASQRVEDDFSRWADAVNLWELQELHCRHMWTDGGYLAHFFLDRSLLRRGLVPLGVELLEYDQLDRKTHGHLANGNVARWGTEYDADGHPVARHIIPCNPGDDILPGMAERRVAQVVGQGNRLDQVFIDAQGPSNGAPQLRDLQRMRETRAEQVALVIQENLRLVDQPPEGRGMHDAVAVALVVGARGRHGLGVAAPTRARRVAGVGRQGIHGQIRFQRLCSKRKQLSIKEHSRRRSPRAPAHRARGGRRPGPGRR